MKKRQILDLVKILESHDISEIEISRWGSKIRIAKKPSGTTHHLTSLPESQTSGKSLQYVEVAGIAEEHKVVKDEDNGRGIEIKSPIVGTFYQAPAPDAEPYVKVGDHISVGQPLCIIEAMKIMNVIESEVSGKLVKILVNDAQPVEYNETLFIINPEG
ncbi:MAG TPA: acetyl-CoA carboxylase biotin carboxyl carrier protein [Candidatus Marinimicrobia bacterium]|nr:acetyl-CoA carboxylase biotin carboxyl carrier protein [Candidatus Neomarinimicrobiota bacterium]